MLITATASAVTITQKKSNNTIISAKKYVARVNQEEKVFKVNNIGKYALYPQITIRGTSLSPTEAKIEERTGETAKEFSVSYPESVENEVYVSNGIKYKEDCIEQKIVLENTGSEDVGATIDLSKAEKTYRVYFPFQQNEKARYVAISPQEEELTGPVTVIEFTGPLPTYPPASVQERKPRLQNVLKWNLDLDAGEIIEIKASYSGAVITEPEKREFSFPSEKNYLLGVTYDSLLNVSNQEITEEELPPTPPEVSGREMLDKINKTLTEEFQSSNQTSFETIPGSIELSKENLSSLEKAIIFREMSKKKKIPSELVIESENGRYYAKARSFVGNIKYEYLPAGKNPGAKEVYTEPQLTECRSSNLMSCLGRETGGQFQLCAGKLCVHVAIIIFLLLMLFGALLAGINYKTEFFYSLVKKTKAGEEKIEEELDGGYKITDEEFQASNPLQKFVIEQINSKGVYNAEKYAENSPYPEVLLDSTVEGLLEKNVIKKIG